MDPVKDASVELLLSAARREGRWDSEGFFTIDREKAAGKLAESLLHDSASWILKVVQAAHRWNVPELRIHELEHALEIQMALPRRLDPQRLMDSLMAPQLAGEDGTEQLCHGLRSVAVGQGKSWALLIRGQGLEARLAAFQGEVSLQTVLNEGCESGTQLHLVVSEPVGQERDALLERARTCGIPLRLNGKRIDDLQLWRGEYENEGKSLCLGMLWARGASTNPLRIPLGVRESRDANAPRYIPPFPEGCRAARLLLVHYNFARSARSTLSRAGQVRPVPTFSRVHLVHDGVLVASANLDIRDGISVDLLLPADSKRVDLTGLSARLERNQIWDAPNLMTAFAGSLGDLGGKIAHRRSSRADLLRLGAAWGTAFLLSPMLAKPLVGASAAFHWRHRHGSLDERLLGKAVSDLETFRRRLPIVLEGRG